MKTATNSATSYIGQEVLQHSQGNPNDGWNIHQYIDFYNRIVRELGFPTVNKAGDSSCYVKETPKDSIMIVLRLKGHLVYLPIGGSETYFSQIKLAKELSDNVANEAEREKAVNMHGKFIHTGKLLADFANKVLVYPKGEKGYDPADRINLNNQIEKMDELLKQAKQ